MKNIKKFTIKLNHLLSPESIGTINIPYYNKSLEEIPILGSLIDYQLEADNYYEFVDFVNSFEEKVQGDFLTEEDVSFISKEVINFIENREKYISSEDYPEKETEFHFIFHLETEELIERFFLYFLRFKEKNIVEIILISGDQNHKQILFVEDLKFKLSLLSQEEFDKLI